MSTENRYENLNLSPPFNEVSTAMYGNMGVCSLYFTPKKEDAVKSLKIASIAGTIAAGGALLNETPVLAQEIKTVVATLDPLKEIKGGLIGASLAVIKEFIDNPGEFFKGFTSKHRGNTAEIVGNAFCGFSLGVTFVDSATFLSSDKPIFLQPSDAKRLVYQTLASIPAAAVMLATTGNIMKWSKKVIDSVRKNIIDIPETREEDERVLKERQALKKLRSWNLKVQEKGRKELADLGIDPRKKR